MTIDDDIQPSAAETLQELLETIVEAFEIEGDVVVEEADGVLRGTVEGAEVDALIGDHGRVLDAIQHIAQRVVLASEGDVRVLVDAGGYRERREAELYRAADRAAEDALASGSEVALPAMSASERRIVHEYLRDRPDVATHSEGDEPRRHLIVAPARA